MTPDCVLKETEGLASWKGLYLGPQGKESRICWSSSPLGREEVKAWIPAEEGLRPTRDSSMEEGVLATQGAGIFGILSHAGI